MINYVDAIGQLYPDVQVSCVGDPTNYNDVVHAAGSAIPSKEELDYVFLEFVKEQHIRYLSDECATRIKFGFISNALGMDKLYDSEPIDQLNLIGTLAIIGPTLENPDGIPGVFAARSPEVHNNMRGPKDYFVHTYAQLKQVMLDGYNFKLGQLVNFNNKRDFINNNILTPEQIHEVTLDSVPIIN